MLYNENITSEYGLSFSVGGSPVAYQPTPSDTNYKNGYFLRWFAKRVNQNITTEIDPNQKNLIDSNLYTVVSLTWRISGPMDPITINNITEKSGVRTENLREIDRVLNETKVDLRQSLKNPLELWRGY